MRVCHWQMCSEQTKQLKHTNLFAHLSVILISLKSLKWFSCLIVPNGAQLLFANFSITCTETKNGTMKKHTQITTANCTGIRPLPEQCLKHLEQQYRLLSIQFTAVTEAGHIHHSCMTRRWVHIDGQGSLSWNINSNTTMK